MDIKALINNIFDSLKTTGDLINAKKKLYWLYNKSTKPKTLIKFSYPAPIGNLELAVRDNKGADAFIVSEVFKYQCYQLPLNIKIKNIIDLGANAGFTAVYLAKLFPEATVVCVEPMPGNIVLLKENLALNKVKHVLVEAAATVNDGTILMDVAEQDYANKVHQIPFGKQVDGAELAVTGMSMDTLLEKLNWNKVDLLKIDIEGYEGLLLATNNSWLAKISTIIIEIHEGVTIDFVKNTTSAFGFNYVVPYKGNWVLSKDKIF